MKRQIIINSLWLLLDQIVRAVAGLVIGILVARYFGPEKFGIFNYVLAVVSLFLACANLGLDNIVIRELTMTPADSPVTLGTTFVLRLLVGTGLAIIVPVVVAILVPGDGTALALAVIMALMLPLQACDTFELPFHAKLQSRVAVVGRNYGAIGSLLARAVLIGLNANILLFAVAILIDRPIACFYMVKNRNAVAWRKWTASRVRARQLLSESWPLILSGIAIIVYMRADQIMITGMLGAAANGIYTVAIRIIEQLFVIPGIMGRSLTPKGMQLGDAEFLPFTEKVAKGMVWAGLAAALLLWLVADWLVARLFGASYAGAGTVLGLLGINLIFQSFSAARSMIVLRRKLFRYDTIFIVLAALLNVVLNYALIPTFGVEGAVIASIIAQGSSMVLFPLLMPETRVLGVTFFRCFRP